MKALSILLVIAGLSVTAAPAQDTLPEVNKKILKYVDSVMGKKVSRGECWDIVKGAMDASGAEWESPEGFGKKIDREKEAIMPGDIIAFRNVSWSTGMTKWHTGPQHYAIVYEMKGEDRMMIAHQNINNKKKVVVTELALKGAKGKITFYRPQDKPNK
jgi:hypothetical protein